jgi:hypothetical protein
MPPSGPDPYYAQFAPKPGCVPLRPLNLGEILDGSFKVVRRNPRATLGLSAIVAVVQATVLAVVQIFAFNQLSSGIDTTNPDNPQVNVGQVVTGELTFAVGALVGALFVAILAGMLTVVITEDVLGKQLSIGQVWNRIKRRMWRLVLLSAVVGIVPGFGLILCIAPGVWLWATWAVAVPALVVENTTVRKSLGRSRALVRGMFWRVLGIRLLGVLMVAFIGFLIGIPFALLAGMVSGHSVLGAGLASSGDSLSVPITYILITSLGSILSTTLTAPIRAGIDALLYVDLRMRKEGLDIVLQQAAAGLTPGPAGPAFAAAPPAAQSPVQGWNPGDPGYEYGRWGGRKH